MKRQIEAAWPGAIAGVVLGVLLMALLTDKPQTPLPCWAEPTYPLPQGLGDYRGKK